MVLISTCSPFNITYTVLGSEDRLLTFPLDILGPHLLEIHCIRVTEDDPVDTYHALYFGKAHDDERGTMIRQMRQAGAEWPLTHQQRLATKDTVDIFIQFANAVVNKRTQAMRRSP